MMMKNVNEWEKGGREISRSAFSFFFLPRFTFRALSFWPWLCCCVTVELALLFALAV